MVATVRQDDAAAGEPVEPLESAPAGKGASLSALVGLLVAIAGLLIGLGPLNDNSFLTHLATGRLILDNHHVPSHDAYSFSATGHSWVVQSWLASLLYGVADKAYGARGLITLVGLAGAALGALVWSLSRPAGALVARLIAVALVIGVGLDFWLERPLMFGLLMLALYLHAAEGRLDPRWLVPAAWLWVNVHGSFPLGLVALALFALGRKLDGGSPRVELRALMWASIGTVLGGINPVGPHLLTFPVELLQRQDVLRHVIEWRAPLFQSLSERVFLVEVVVGILLLCRRPSWRIALPLAVFTAASLVGSRNIVVASIVMLPGIAVGLAGIGTIDGRERKPIFRTGIIVLSVFAVLLFPISYQRHIYQLGGYPVSAVNWLADEGFIHDGAHIVGPDFVGNYLEARYGPRRMVFVDDRYDMYPRALIEDYVVLNKGGKGWEPILRKYAPDAVVWQVDEPLGQLLSASPNWQVRYTDPRGKWLVATPKAGS
jgi:hypothetical protein